MIDITKLKRVVNIVNIIIVVITNIIRIRTNIITIKNTDDHKYNHHTFNQHARDSTSLSTSEVTEYKSEIILYFIRHQRQKKMS